LSAREYICFAFARTDKIASTALHLTGYGRLRHSGISVIPLSTAPIQKGNKDFYPVVSPNTLTDREMHNSRPLAAGRTISDCFMVIMTGLSKNSPYISG
jgi:hypothetical protein